MSVESVWKVTPNLTLAHGREHPPARFPDSMTEQFGKEPLLEARHVAPFNSTLYCGLQHIESSGVFDRLVRYYRSQFERIPLWSHPLRRRGGVKKEEERPTGIKEEADNEDEGGGGGAYDGGSGDAAGVYRALGIITQAGEDTDETVTPWEFIIVRSVSDPSTYAPAFAAMRQEVDPARFPLLSDRWAATGENGDDTNNNNNAGGEATSLQGWPAPAREARTAADEGLRLSLFTRLLGDFTGVYPGMAVGVIGRVRHRTARGGLTALLVEELVFPTPPALPWGLGRPPLPPAALAHLKGRKTRLHFCTGPFPRFNIEVLLRIVTAQALRRQADVLVIGGPLVRCLEGAEADALDSLGSSFDAFLSRFVDVIETAMAQHYQMRPREPRMKVVLVAHREDVTQVPVLPTTMYPLQRTEDICLLSNPCRLSVNGVHVGVVNEDTVGGMQQRMVERWSTSEGHLCRSVEAFVDSRLYTPLHAFPSPQVDLLHLDELRMDYVPPASAASRLEDEDADGEQGPANWSLLEQLAASAGGGDAEGPAPKRIKTESTEGPAVAGGAAYASAVEMYPHIVLAASARPPFAFVTRQAKTGDEAGVAEAEEEATGVFVVNQQIWSRRRAARFELSIAEVTIEDSAVVVEQGAREGTGVSCGFFRVFKDDNAS